MNDSQDLVTAEEYRRGLACYEAILAEPLRADYEVNEKTFLLREEVYDRLFRPSTPEIVRLMEEAMAEPASLPSRMIDVFALVFLVAALTTSSRTLLMMSVVLMLVSLALFMRRWRLRGRALERLSRASAQIDAAPAE